MIKESSSFTEKFCWSTFTFTALWHLLMFVLNFLLWMITSQWRIQGRGPGGTAPRYFLTKMRPERPKKSFWRPGPSLISLSRWPPPPPYVRVWMTRRPRPFQILLGNFLATFRILSNFFVREQLLATFWKTSTFLVTFRLFLTKMLNNPFF